MFGLGFTEIVFIAIVAVIFLGPDKLPEAMVQVAKFMGSFRKTVSQAKSSFEQEMHLGELKEEARAYREKFEEASNDIQGFKNAIPNPADEVNKALSMLDETEDTTTPQFKKTKKSSKKPKSEKPDSEKPKSDDGEVS